MQISKKKIKKTNKKNCNSTLTLMTKKGGTEIKKNQIKQLHTTVL